MQVLPCKHARKKSKKTKDVARHHITFPMHAPNRTLTLMLILTYGSDLVHM